MAEPSWRTQWEEGKLELRRLSHKAKVAETQVAGLGLGLEVRPTQALGQLLVVTP